MVLPDGWDAGWLGCLIWLVVESFISSSFDALNQFLGPQIVKNCVQKAKRRRWQAFRNQERHPDALKDPFSQKPPPIFTHFGVPPGTPKSTKNRFVAQKSGSTEDFESIFVVTVDFLVFPLIFPLIFYENCRKNDKGQNCRFSRFLPDLL